MSSVSPARLLLVDDEQDIRTVARLSLERVGGWSVTAVGSGAEALVAVASSEGPFDAVLLDVMMPGDDGPATLARLRRGPLGEEGPLGENVPVVFLTAKAGAADRAGLESLGAAGVIAKPFDPLALPGLLERVLAGAVGGGGRRAGQVSVEHPTGRSAG